MNNESYCVNRIEGSKIYIHSENIIPTEQGVLINLNGHDQVYVPLLGSDLGGCFVDTRPMWSEIIPRCSSCKKPVYDGVCRNPACDRYGR